MEKAASFLETGMLEEAGKSQANVRTRSAYWEQRQQHKPSVVVAPAEIKCNAMYCAIKDSSFCSLTQNLILPNIVRYS